MRMNIGFAPGLAGAVLLGGIVFAVTPAHATLWTDWTSATIGAPGSAAGTVNGVGVAYAGEVLNDTTNGTTTIWSPNSTFIGGTSSASPSTVGDAIFLNGSFTGTNTITFASSVTDPVFAIWSLGAPSAKASFTFNATPTLQAGGPNSQFGGSSIGVVGNTVSGNEGNGVVEFTGTFTTISWTDTFENFYAFTVGVNGGTPVSSVPEPGSLALLGAALAGLGFTRLRKGDRKA